MDHDEPELPDGPLAAAYRQRMAAVPPAAPERARASIEAAMRVYDDERAHHGATVTPMRARRSRAVLGAAASALVIVGAMAVVLRPDGGDDAELSSPGVEEQAAQTFVGEARGVTDGGDPGDDVADSGDDPEDAAGSDASLEMAEAETALGDPIEATEREAGTEADTGTETETETDTGTETDTDTKTDTDSETDTDTETGQTTDPTDPTETTDAEPSDPPMMGTASPTNLESEADLLAFADAGGVPGTVMPPCAPDGATALGPAIYAGREVVVLAVTGDDGDEVTAIDPDTCAVVASVARSAGG